MRRLVDASWVDERLPRDYWEKLDSKRVMQLRSEVKHGTVELDEPEAAEQGKVDARFAKALASEWQRWKALGIPPILRSPEHLRRKRRWKDGLTCQSQDRRTRSSSGASRCS